MSSEGGHDFSHTAAEFPFRTFCGYCGTYLDNDEHTAEGREARLRKAAISAKGIIDAVINGNLPELKQFEQTSGELSEALKKPLTCKQILHRRKQREKSDAAAR